MSLSATIEPIMAPDYDAMLQHLEYLFGRAMDGHDRNCLDGHQNETPTARRIV